MELLRLEKKDQSTYNRFVMAHPSGSFLQSWEWGDWQEQLGHKAHRVTIKDGETIVLSAQVLEMKIPGLNQHYLYLPYGPLLQESAINVINFSLSRCTTASIIARRFTRVLRLMLLPPLNMILLLI